MDNHAKIMSKLKDSYGLEVSAMAPMSLGVGGDTYRVTAAQGEFVYKIMEADTMNHPAGEPKLCAYLLDRGIPVSIFVRNREGRWITPIEGRISHLQEYIRGRTFPMNGTPEWFMAESPKLLAGIHNALRAFPPLPVGIGSNFFRYMTPDRGKTSYHASLEKAAARGETGILEDLRYRLEILEYIRDWHFDISRLTCRNTHGDFTVNQILCGEDRINAVIDWTSACVHPVIWEITRSFFYADPSCREGCFDESRFAAYISAYTALAPLNEYDRANMLKLFYYQLAVCDYYAQYLDAPEEKKGEFLQQARFATSILRNMPRDSMEHPGS